MSDQQKPKPLATPLEKLTGKRRKFVEAYVLDTKGNATRAATSAGYASPRREGCRLLTFDDIRAAVAWLYKQTSMTPEEIVGRLEGMAKADLTDAMTPVYRQEKRPVLDPETGEPTDKTEWVDTEEITGYRVDSRLLVETGLMAYVKSVKETRHGTVYELEDRQAALDKIARALGIYREEGATVQVVVKVVEGVDMEAI